jgi:hypothetical protein
VAPPKDGSMELAAFYKQHVYPGGGSSPTPRAVSSLRPLRGREPASPQVRFCRCRCSPSGELGYRGAVGLGYRPTV